MTVTSPRPERKSGLHPRNRHNGRYDFAALITACPALARHVRKSPRGEETIDFANPDAVKLLNQALLSLHYGIRDWDIPAGFLCPPIPGRADMLHRLADLLADSNGGPLPATVRMLDIGTGANCIYPLIAQAEYGWQCVGSDISRFALDAAWRILDANPELKTRIGLRHQHNGMQMFTGVIKDDERFDLTVCNPPFHATAREADAANRRKVGNLTGKKPDKAQPNFGGKSNELWCEGGEAAFLSRLAVDSQRFAKRCFWFSSLVSKEANLDGFYRHLDHLGIHARRTLRMSQGQKTSRVVAWTFLDDAAQAAWRARDWQPSTPD